MKKVLKNIQTSQDTEVFIPSGNLFSKSILYKDINGGVSPVTLLDIPFAILNNDEIFNIYCELIDVFIDSASNNDLTVNFWDITNNIQIWQILTPGADVDPFSIWYIDNVFRFNIGNENYKIHSLRTIVLRCQGTDLTKLTAGKFTASLQTVKMF